MRELADAVSIAQAAGRHASFAGGTRSSSSTRSPSTRWRRSSRCQALRARCSRRSARRAAWSRTRSACATRRRGAPISRCRRNDSLRAVEIAYGLRPEDESGEHVVRSAVVVPLRIDGARVGTLSAFSRSAAGRFDPAAVEEIEQVAERATPALVECAQVHRGAGAGRPRPAHEAPQPPASSTSSSSARWPGRTATAGGFGADPRRRRLPGAEHPHRPARRGRRARRAGRPAPRCGADGRHRLPDRRRRVRRDPAGVGGGRRRAARDADRARRRGARRRRRVGGAPVGGCLRSAARGSRGTISCSGPTRRSARPRASAAGAAATG